LYPVSNSCIRRHDIAGRVYNNFFLDILSFCINGQINQGLPSIFIDSIVKMQTGATRLCQQVLDDIPADHERTHFIGMGISEGIDEISSHFVADLFADRRYVSFNK